MNSICKIGFAGLVFVLGTSVANAAVTFSGFSTAVTNGGDGSVSASSPFPTITITGSNNGVGQSLTQYTATVATGGTFSFNWGYQSNDSSGAYVPASPFGPAVYLDPAGYIIGSTMYQLSGQNINSSGLQSVTLNAGDTFGWYVDSTDSLYGAGVLSITPADVVTSPVPEPSSYAMLLAGLGLIGFIAYRRRNDASGMMMAA